MKISFGILKLYKGIYFEVRKLLHVFLMLFLCEIARSIHALFSVKLLCVVLSVIHAIYIRDIDINMLHYHCRSKFCDKIAKFEKRPLKEDLLFCSK